MWKGINGAVVAGYDVRVYVKLDDFSFYFADSTEQAF